MSIHRRSSSEDLEIEQLRAVLTEQDGTINKNWETLADLQKVSYQNNAILHDLGTQRQMLDEEQHRLNEQVDHMEANLTRFGRGSRDVKIKPELTVNMRHTVAKCIGIGLIAIGFIIIAIKKM